MADTITTRKGRVFFQMQPMHSFDLFQCSGLSDWNLPRGAVAPIREQSVDSVGQEDTTGYTRGQKDMPQFTVQSRFRETHNVLFGLKCEIAVQVLTKDCGDPGDYTGFKVGLGWVRCPPGDLTGEALAIIDGNDVAVGMQNPFNAVYGPYIIDFAVQFLSQRPIAEQGAIVDLIMFAEECIEDCQFMAGNGQYGYAVAEPQAGSVVDAANVWFTENYGDAWAITSENPFGAAVDLTSIVKAGTVTNHRVVASRGLVGGSPARIAYADTTVIGQTAWVGVNVGSVNGEYITYMSMPSFAHLYAVTNLGRIYRSKDGGVTWTIMYTHATTVQLNEVTATKRGVVWAVGDSDVLVYSSDHGATWTLVTGPNDGLYNLTTCDIGVDGIQLMVGDSAGTIHGTIDNGINWITKEAQGIVATNIRRIRVHDTYWWWTIADIAAVAPYNGNSRVLRSTDGGAAFMLWELAQNINPNNGLRALAVVDQNRVVVAGEPYPVPGNAFLSRTSTNVDRMPA